MVGVRSTRVQSSVRIVSAREEKSEAGVVMQTVEPCCAGQIRQESFTTSDGASVQQACPRCS